MLAVETKKLTYLVAAGGAQLTVLTDAGRKPGGSWSAEMSSDAEYYTPLGSPDEPRLLSSAVNAAVIHVDELEKAAILTSAVTGKVIIIIVVRRCSHLHIV